MPQKTWEQKNYDVRIFLLEQYKGHCQICNLAFDKRDGEPYFEGMYLVSRAKGRWIDRPGNVLCLCPTCCTKLQVGSVEADDIVEQVGAFRTFLEGGVDQPSLNLQLCGDIVKIKFTERHFLDLQEIILVSKGNRVASDDPDAEGI